MTVRVNKDSFNLREKLSELERPIGLKGNELMSAETAQEARDLVSAGRKNILINGDMRVAQRSTSAVNNVTAGSNPDYKTLDRWGSWAHTNNLFTTQQVADAPSGFYNSIKVTSLASTGMGTGGYASVSQRIEAQNLYSSNIGTSTAKDFIVSFWVKGSISGQYSFYAFNSSWSESFTKEYTINVANTWEHKTLTIPGQTTGFSATGNARQLEIGFSLGAGTTWSTSVLDKWQTSTFKLNSSTAINLLETSGATLNFTGVQLEVGKNATDFEHRSYGEELALCQRYFYKKEDDVWGYNISTGGSYFRSPIDFPVTMRTTPTMLVISADYGSATSYGFQFLGVNGVTYYWNTPGALVKISSLSAAAEL